MYKSDIEIAQSVEMKRITEIAETAGIEDKYLEQYGKYKAKIDLSLLKENSRPNGTSGLLFFLLYAEPQIHATGFSTHRVRKGTAWGRSPACRTASPGLGSV